MRPVLSNRLLILIGVLLALESVQSSLIHFGGRVDLLYLLILDSAFFWDWEWMPLFAFGVGLLLDFFGGHLFGIETISLTASGCLLFIALQKLDRESIWVRWCVSFVFVALTETLSVSLGSWLELSRNPSFQLMGNVFQTTFYTTLMAPAFFWFTGLWFKRTPVLRQYELFR